ncbi:MAG: CBS domain-containing protein [Thaumarchaeota archaeon]|nr:MAG: CBS domain-containing protein [Nitrososphaerota archaeon]
MSLEELVKDVMEKNVQTVDLDASAKKSAAVMGKKGIGSLVVVQGGTAVGIVTERDLVSRVIADGLDPAKVLVRDIMSTPLITIQPDAKIAEAARLMNEYKIRRVVVTAADGSLAGIVTASDLARVLAERKDYSDMTLNAIARASPDKGPYQ